MYNITTLPGLEEYATPALNPFFSYFGSKYKLAKFYSAPKYDTIIEPFAGAAGYSLMYPQKQVKLYDVYEKVTGLWDYLIHVSEKEILSLPLGPFTRNNKVTDQKIAQEAQWLIGYWIVESQTHPSKNIYKRGGSWDESHRKRIADQLQYIRHWTVEQKSYEQIDNLAATWYVDPPYKISGVRYKHSSKKIHYHALGQWCQSRQGQVIVCEGYPEGEKSPTWLPFKPLGDYRNASNEEYGEVVWEK